MSADWTRRRFLQATLATGGGLAAAPLLGATAAPDLELKLAAAPDRASIWKGEPTRVLRYAAEVVRGRPDAVRPGDGYLGPTLELRRGERVRIRFENHLAEPSIVHWHGLVVPEAADGHPHHAVPPGGRYVYDFTVVNPAGTYLYHPHPHGRTGYQVYYGLAGLLIVREPVESAIGLPSGPEELALVIQDRRATADHQFAFKRMMMDDMNGVLGDVVLANGRADALFRVAPRAHRLRIANASNARIYKLAWSDGAPLRVIGGGNGLLGAVVERPYVMLAPFERVELLEDFGARPPGAEIALLSGAFSVGGMMGGGMMGRGMMGGGMMGGMMNGGQGEELRIARFAIGREGARRAGPLALRPEPSPPTAGAVARRTQLAMQQMRGLLNGRSFEMRAVAPDERLPLGKPAVWTFTNATGMMAMPHPMHLHMVRFRVLERGPRSSLPASVAEGIVDDGYRDMVLVFPGETVRLAVVPTEPGLSMVHCHNLEHEDAGMMRNFLVAA
ncbi:MAG: multicopper oxidase family protein [Burkholderiales bacterium]